MKKQLPTNGIANELADASVFFQKRTIIPEAKPRTPTAITSQPTDQQQIGRGTDDESIEHQTQSKSTAMMMQQVAYADNMTASNHATMPPSSEAEPLANDQAAMRPRHHDLMPPLALEQIRKVVKQVGKEAATYRLTQAEKQALADIVYTYKRRGYRTSDNELARIAINWLVLDYQTQGELSLLARVLETLHR